MRSDHHTLAIRMLGDHAHGTQGTPVTALARLASQRFFPRLWEIRALITTDCPPGLSGHAAT